MRVVLTGIVLIVLMVLTGTIASVAANPTGPVLDDAVSTRPIDAARKASVAPSRRPLVSTHAPALTRAAAQRRIDEMSPTDWLSLYGHVSVGQRR